MENLADFKMPGVKELGGVELMRIDGGKLTRNQEIWIERGIAYLLLGIPGVLLYELGRQNG